MSGSLSGQITIQGLGSGTDFSEIISKLKTFQSIPKMRMEIWREEWNMRITGFQDILTAITECKTALSSLNSMNEMLSKSVSSAKSEVATAKADASIEEGSYSIDVLQLAKPAIYSNKQVFSAKSEKINTSGEDQTFTYTYKGTTRSITVANNCTLEQLVNKINNDGKNPGVSANLIKSGSGYVFQLQGKETGAAASLSVESSLAAFDSSPHFSGRDAVINTTGNTESFTYYYKGKSQTLDITSGMTAAQFVSAFNNDPDNLGVVASLVQDGNNFKLQYKDAATQAAVNLTASSNLDALGSLKTMQLTDVVNDSGETQTFHYSYLGKSYSFNVANGTTVQSFIDQFNAKAADNNLRAELDGGGNLVFIAQDATLLSNDGNPMSFQYTDKDGALRTLDVADGTTAKEFLNQLNTDLKSSGWTAQLRDTGSDWQIVILDEGGNEATAASPTANFDFANLSVGDQQTTLGYTSNMSLLGGRSALSPETVSVNDTASAEAYSFTYNGSTFSFNVASGTSLNDFISQFNAMGAGVTAQVSGTGGGYGITFVDDVSGEAVNLDNVSTNLNRVRGASDNYYIQQSTDAIFTMNGWPMEMSSSSNTLTEVIAGLEITIKSEGATTLTVANDTDKLKENVAAAVDAINNMLAAIRQLTKFDEEKDVKSPSVNDTTGLLEMSSQFTWQKGEVLQGNYGVQLLQSRLKNMIVSSAKGFTPKTSASDYLGDTYSVLSAIGVSTCTDESDPNFGLLVIDNEKLQNAIDSNINNVAELFSLEPTGTTQSSDFWVASTGTRAKAGSYNVTYDVDPITKQATNVYINGCKASTDEAYPGRWTVGDYDNDAAGLAIQFGEEDLVPTGVTQRSTVQVKEGKINELVRQLDAELQPVVEGSKESAGALPLLIDNYKGVISNIDAKIDREVGRLALWEKRQKAKFSRLDTLLNKYYSQMEANESSLAQLSSGSKS